MASGGDMKRIWRAAGNAPQMAAFAAGLMLPAPALAQTPPGVPDSSILLSLPRDLSPWGMFLSADIVVKAVLIGLAFASVLSWTVWFAKTIELVGARSRMRQATEAIENAPSWREATAGPSSRKGAAADLVGAAETELNLSADALVSDGVKERIASRMARLEAAAARRMIRGTGILASIGATAPFVGLFGTVWGIMNSFIGISKAHTTNLAVVAPGIAEALLATALGLFAAIPAVVIYNVFSRAIGGYRALLADGSALVMRLVSRDLDYRGMPKRALAAE